VQSNEIRILFAGGGTGGHLFPAIAIADEIKKLRPEVQIAFAGTRGRIEARVVPQQGYRFFPIWISGFRRKRPMDNLLFPLKVMVACVQSFVLIRRFRPDVVVGTGGYVCGPVVLMASLVGVPTVLQEQNSYPGVTTRLLASRATEVHVTFESSLRYLKRTGNVRITGNPTRGSLGSIARPQAAKFFELDSQRRTLLVFGGSLGAHSLNTWLLNALPALLEKNLQIIWQTGEQEFQEMRAAVTAAQAGASVKVHKFIEKMEYAFGACDLAVSRAGATTVAELMRAGIPSVLVPYPYAAGDHQTENARAMVEAGASLLVKDNELESRLFGVITGLVYDTVRLQQMREKALELAKPKAAATIASAVLAHARKQRNGTGKDV
jgi:UDP-N-acetylglucosamine--N-acetylmuramyl-(pentapeptide) pyrophosphoryl-undecaprenol N-acetylglucosamine transferase